MATRTSELISLRSRGAKHFETDAPGERQAVLGENVHFLDAADTWQDYADLVQEVPGGFAATVKDARFGIENGYITITYKGRSLQMRPESIALVDRTAPGTRNLTLATADYSDSTRDDNTITVHNIFPQTDLTVTITHDSITKMFTIRQRPNFPDPTSLGWDASKTYLVIVWDVQKPDGATIEDSDGVAFAPGYVGNKDLVVKDNLGQPVIIFLAGSATSSVKNKTSPVYYVRLGTQVPFGEAYPYSKADIATYPVYLDPTSTIGYTGASWGYAMADWPLFEVGVSYGPGSEAIGRDAYDDGKGGGWDYVFRTFQRYDLTPLSGATANSVRLELAMASGGWGVAFDVYKTATDWNPLDANDYQMTATQVGTTLMPSTFYVFAPTWDGTYFYGIGSNRVYRSTDGVLWTALTNSPPQRLKMVAARDSTHFLAITYANGTYAPFKTTDGGASAWSDIAYTFSYNFLYAANNTFVAITHTGSVGYVENGEVITSVSAHGMPTGGTESDVRCVYGNGTWVFTRGFSSAYRRYVHYTTNLASGTYTQYDLGSASGLGASDGCYGSSQFVIVGYDGNAGCAWTSTDGTSWTKRTSALAVTAKWVTAVAWDGTYFLAVNADGTMFRSTDAITWSTAGSSGYTNATRMVSDGAGTTIVSISFAGVFWTTKDHGATKFTGPSASLTNGDIQSAFGGWVGIEIRAAITSDAPLAALTPHASHLIIDYTAAVTSPTWVSPADASSTNDTTPELVFTSVAQAAAAHFELQLDTANTFNTGNFLSLRTSISQTGWEYYDGAAWQALPASGMPANKTGNNVRYTPSALALGIWYRRVRQG